MRGGGAPEIAGTSGCRRRERNAKPRGDVGKHHFLGLARREPSLRRDHQDGAVLAALERRVLQGDVGHLVAQLFVNLQDLLRFVRALQPRQDGERVKERRDVEVLPAAESHLEHVLVRVQRFRESPLGRVDGPQVEPGSGVAGVGFDHALEGGFRVRITQLALVQDAEVVIDGREFGVHLLGRGQFAQGGVEVVRLDHRHAEVEVVRRHGVPRSHHFLKLGDRFRVLALFVVRLAEVARGLDRVAVAR